MLDTIKQFLKEHEIDEKAGFIIAVSGVADSITLLHAFKYLNLRIHACIALQPAGQRIEHG